ncbi:MAG TPA: lysophospholipid acyltransferase family protein [Bacteroidales bacterium]|nr:lysophospholipid acyltransferase family protein [Bacteroidales bacterium]
MEAVLFYIFYLLNWLVTLLPLRVLYFFSDFLFLVLYYFPGYRRDVVSMNLRNAFPEKSDKERAGIEKKFYRHLADLFVETLKMEHFPEAEHRKRCTYENPELLNRLYDEGKDIVAVLGHYNNWETQNILPRYLKHTTISIYRPLKNKHFDRFLLKLRSQFGMVLSPTSMVIREIVNRRKAGERTMSVFLADQTPAITDIHYWTRFMNQDTPVYLGAEKIAMKYNMAVVFINQQKTGRGRYHVKFELLFEDTAGLKEFEITEAHVRHLEEIINRNPEFWIWSHKRWKHKRPAADA